MSEYIENVVGQEERLDWAFPFQRTGKFPLDRSYLFSSVEDAELYAKGDGSDERKLGGTSYCGQIIAAYDSSIDSIRLYLIDIDRSLRELILSGDIIDGGLAKDADPENANNMIY